LLSQGCSWALSRAVWMCGWKAREIRRADARWAWHAEVAPEIVLAAGNVREEVAHQRA